MAGCGADQNPYPRRTLDLAKQHGRSLSNAVEAALASRSGRVIHGPVQSALENVELRFAEPPTREQLVERTKENHRRRAAYAKRLLRRLEREGRLRTDYAFPLQVVQFGSDLTMVALCGEPVVDYSLRLQRELSPANRVDSDGSVAWIAGYSNHVFGYLPSRRVLIEGGYEGGDAMISTNYPGPFAESVEDRVIDKVLSMAMPLRRSSTDSRGSVSQ